MKSFRVPIERELRGRGFDHFSGREPLGKFLGRIIENHIAHNRRTLFRILPLQRLRNPTRFL